MRLQGERIGAERVRRSLQRQGLRPVYKRPYRITTDSTHRLPVAPNLLQRRFDGWSPNQAWVSDITFISTGRIKLSPGYLSPVEYRESLCLTT